MMTKEEIVKPYLVTGEIDSFTYDNLLFTENAYKAMDTYASQHSAGLLVKVVGLRRALEELVNVASRYGDDLQLWNLTSAVGNARKALSEFLNHP